MCKIYAVSEDTERQRVFVAFFRNDNVKLTLQPETEIITNELAKHKTRLSLVFK